MENGDSLKIMCLISEIGHGFFGSNGFFIFYP